MNWKNLLQLDLASDDQRDHLARLALRRNWDRALVLVGWLHLLAFGICYYLTIVCNYHEPVGYLTVWSSEVCGMVLIFRICGGRRPAAEAVLPLESLLRRVWVAYFILAFDLGSLNTLRGHKMFEFFPAFGPLASFAFLVMTLMIDWRFFGAVLVMYGAGLLMAAYLWHAFLVFALAWWLVLNAIGLTLWRRRSRADRERPVAPAWVTRPAPAPGAVECKVNKD